MRSAVALLFIGVMFAGCTVITHDPADDFNITCPAWISGPDKPQTTINFIHNGTSESEDFREKDDHILSVYRPTTTFKHNWNGSITDFYEIKLEVGAIYHNRTMYGQPHDTRIEVTAHRYEGEKFPTPANETPAPATGDLLLFRDMSGKATQYKAALVFPPGDIQGESISKTVWVETRRADGSMDPADLRIDWHFFGDQDGKLTTDSVGSVHATVTRWYLREPCVP